MIIFIKNIYKKYEEIIGYLFWGGMAFFLNLILYPIFKDLLGMNYLVANALDWLLCVLFAYTTNRTFVFKSEVKGLAAIWNEFVKFFSCRVISGIMDMGLMFLMVSIWHMADPFPKIITQIVVIVSNYIFSKVFIFNGKEKE